MIKNKYEIIRYGEKDILAKIRLKKKRILSNWKMGGLFGFLRWIKTSKKSPFLYKFDESFLAKYQIWIIYFDDMCVYVLFFVMSDFLVCKQRTVVEDLKGFGDN